ncbi:transmembrane protein, putative, partial [Rhizoctonia solani AG-3 Rhs1AP]
MSPSTNTYIIVAASLGLVTFISLCLSCLCGVRRVLNTPYNLTPSTPLATPTPRFPQENPEASIQALRTYLEAQGIPMSPIPAYSRSAPV